MSEQQTTTAGRKPTLTMVEKRDIINRYLIANDQDPAVLTNHGVCENLAKFARTLNAKYRSVRGYHFYGADIKSYIFALIDDVSADDKTKQIGCAYIPLDFAAINQLARRHRYDELIDVLHKRENYLCSLYDKVARAAAQNEFISSKFAMKAQELQTQEVTLSALESEVDRLNAIGKEMTRKSVHYRMKSVF